MNFRFHLVGTLAAALLVITGCATRPQPPVGLQKSALSSGSVRVGVVMTTLPTVDTSLPGAGCLLCMAAASIANSSLTSHAKTLPVEDLPKLKEAMAALVRQRGAEPVMISESIRLDTIPDASAKGDTLARKDFSVLAKKYQLDKLLVIDITQLGFERTYSSYVPTSAPNAVMRGTGSLIDLKTNTLEWLQPLSVMRGADGPWDEPPKFPGLTNAYFQVLEIGKDELLQGLRP